MTTIYTTLPIYDQLAKQAYQRSRHAGMDKPFAVSCPINQLPSFQWIDGADGCTSVTTINLIDTAGNVTDITTYFNTLPTLVTLTAASYFVYSGGAMASSVPCGLYYLQIIMDNAKTYYSEYFLAEDITDCLIINFYNVCDLGTILYQTGFTQNLWLRTEPMEEIYPIEETMLTNGEGRQVRVFARQTKKYLVRTLTLPYYLVDVFNRMKLHDSVELTDLFGDTREVFNLEVEHEWLHEDKYYAKIELTFDHDETCVVSGCCNNLT